MAKYQEISQWLHEKIEDGTFAVGEKIPSENDLALKFGYSRQTVRQAVSLLESEGILTRAQGSGTFVNRSAIQKEQCVTMRVGVIACCPDDYISPALSGGLKLYWANTTTPFCYVSHTTARLTRKPRCGGCLSVV